MFVKITVLGTGILIIGGWLFPMNTQAAIQTKTIEYKCNDVILEGYLAYDDAIKERVPGVLIVHEWRGIGDYEKMRAEKIASLGYVGLVIDIYGKGIRPKDDKEAAKQTHFYRANRPLMRKRAQAGLDEIRKLKFVDPNRIAIMGYCFGGTVSLELARSGADIKGAVSFHGSLETPFPQETKNLKAKILVLHGADDPSVTAEQISVFQNEMRSAKADWQMVYYGNAVHRFSNPMAGENSASGFAYNQEADLRSWEAMKSFFKEIFS
jgi:dienelactone hydrolase